MEEAGIFVLLAGNLGSYHSNIPTETFRGFAIADPIAPFIVINDQDARASWSFTALHEATHIWLGTTGVSGYLPNSQIERFCNDVAGEVLLPASDIRNLVSVGAVPFNDLVQRISDLADELKVSRSMIAYKLLRSGIIDDPQWMDLAARFRADWLAAKSQSRDGDPGNRGGPSYYVVRRHRLGPALLSLMSRALGEGSITPTKAAHVLGVKPRNVEPLLRDALPLGVA